eukprot:CAMPEP_0119043944 /NCGR_PEP_ID=MMETSP1177-20130426/27150_1 /TAXON_ID=2985 /ORGANISM="Ochromonas sp, Strain CCMP1899" /LENGTH=407 /DNA_ID=CAMNT_0007013129 /DNA_START=269 /DNA_END=1492 /DNA_ORIENTATION=-
MSKLKSMQGQIMKNVELVQDRTSRVLQEQERDLLRAFRARLFDVQTELEKEKSKKEDGAGAWIERSRKLESEVEWAKEVADRLERVNQALLTENTRLKSQFTSQEEDRNFLIAQLVGVKKENAQLKAEYSAIGLENETLENQLKKLEEDIKNGVGNGNTPGGNPGGTPGGRQAGTHRDSVNKGHNSTGATDTVADERYKEINSRLRRLLSEERKALQHVRTNYAAELRSRTEIEMLLRQCVDDVKKEISLRSFGVPVSRTGSRPGSSAGPLVVGKSTSSFTQADRERTLELLLSQERVISLIYAKTFPINQPGKSKHNAGTASTAFESNSNIQNQNSNDTSGVDAEILHAISLGLTNNTSNHGISTYKTPEEEDDPDDRSISEGGGGPLIAAAMLDMGENSDRLPAI